MRGVLASVRKCDRHCQDGGRLYFTRQVSVIVLLAEVTIPDHYRRPALEWAKSIEKKKVCAAVIMGLSVSGDKKRECRSTPPPAVQITSAIHAFG